MAQANWADLMSKAEAPSFGTGRLLPKARYTGEIVSRKAGNKNGKDRLGICLLIQEGEEGVGERIWDNWTVSPESPKALGIFFQNFALLGGDLEVLKMGGNLETASAGMVGNVVDFDLDVDEYPKGNTPPTLVNRVRRYYVVNQEAVPTPPHASAPAHPKLGGAAPELGVTLGGKKAPF